MDKTKALGVVLLELPESQKRLLSAFIRCILPDSKLTFESAAKDIDGNEQCVLKVEIPEDDE